MSDGLYFRTGAKTHGPFTRLEFEWLADHPPRREMERAEQRHAGDVCRAHNVLAFPTVRVVLSGKTKDYMNWIGPLHPISILSQLVAELTRLDGDRIARLKASLQARAVSLFDDLEAIDAELDAHLYDASDGGVERKPEGPGGDDGTLAARSRRHQRQRRDRASSPTILPSVFHPRLEIHPSGAI